MYDTHTVILTQFYLCHNLAPNVEDIMLPNGTVPSDRINPNSIIVDLPITAQPYRYCNTKSLTRSVLTTCIVLYIAMFG